MFIFFQTLAEISALCRSLQRTRTRDRNSPVLFDHTPARRCSASALRRFPSGGNIYFGSRCTSLSLAGRGAGRGIYIKIYKKGNVTIRCAFQRKSETGFSPACHPLVQRKGRLEPHIRSPWTPSSHCSQLLALLAAPIILPLLLSPNHGPGFVLK